MYFCYQTNHYHVGMDLFKSCFPGEYQGLCGRFMCSQTWWVVLKGQICGICGISGVTAWALSSCCPTHITPIICFSISPLCMLWEANTYVTLYVWAACAIIFASVWTVAMVVIFCSRCHKYSLFYDIIPLPCESIEFFFSACCAICASCISNKSDLAVHGIIFSSHGNHQVL